MNNNEKSQTHLHPNNKRSIQRLEINKRKESSI